MPETLLAVTLPFSPPVALFIIAWLSMQRRSQLLYSVRDDLSSKVAMVGLAVAGLAWAVKLRFNHQVLGDILAMLALIWLFKVGESVLSSPAVFVRNLSRSLGFLSFASLVMAYFPLAVSAKMQLLGQIVVFYGHTVGDGKNTVLLGLPANSLGPLLVACFVLGYGRLFWENFLVRRIESAVIALMGLGAAVAMQVRLAVLGAVAGAVFFSVAVGIRSLLVVGLVSLSFIVSSPGLLGRFRNLLAVSQTDPGRPYGWMTALRLAQDNLLFGIGPAQYPIVYQNLKPSLAFPDMLNPHNAYLRIFAEWGLVSLLFFGWLFLKLDKVWVRRDHMLRWALVSAVVAFLFMSLFETYFLKFHVVTPFWLLLGLAQREDL